MDEEPARVAVTDMKHPTKADIERVLTAALMGKIPVEGAATFIRQAAVAPIRFLEALREIASGSAKVSQRAIDVIFRTIPVLETLAEKATTEEERREIREQVIHLINQATHVAQEQQAFGWRLAKMAGGVVLVTVAAAVYMFSKGAAGREVMQAGEKLLKGLPKA
jgi:hypothetical protein